MRLLRIQYSRSRGTRILWQRTRFRRKSPQSETKERSHRTLMMMMRCGGRGRRGGGGGGRGGCVVIACSTHHTQQAEPICVDRSRSFVMEPDSRTTGVIVRIAFYRALCSFSTNRSRIKPQSQSQTKSLRFVCECVGVAHINIELRVAQPEKKPLANNDHPDPMHHIS